jgi:hypothetical protein
VIRKLWAWSQLGCLGSLILAVPVSSAVAAPTPVPFMPDVDTWVVTSAGSHRTYQIWVARPGGYTKQHAPYPVLYVGDASTLFGIAAETAYLLAISKQIPAVVVVGIGYPKPGQGLRSSWVGRHLDFTPPVNKAWTERILENYADQSKAYGYEPDSGDIPVTDIQEFAAQLRSHCSGLSVDVHIFEGENHSSGSPAAFSRGLRSIYQDVSESGSK